MLAFTLRFIKNKRYFAILTGALVIIAGLASQHAWSGNGLPQINGKALAALAKQHPVVVLFRHAERCDRSDNTCLSDSTGITVNGAQDACSGSQKARTRSKKDATPCCVAFYVNYWPECSDLGYG